MSRFLSKYLWMLLVFFSIGIIATAQELEDICSQFIESAYTQLGQNCAGLEPNSFCYGYGTVSPTFIDLNGELISEEAREAFTVGDQGLLYDPETNLMIDSIATSAIFAQLDAEAEAEAESTESAEATEVPEATPEAEVASVPWGISVIYTPANIPQQMESAGARIIIFGETRVHNAVTPETLFIPGEIINVSVENAEIFTAPPEYRIPSSVIDTVSGEFEADAISPDGEWVRVFYIYEGVYATRVAAWLPVASLLDEPDLTALPLLGANYGTAMQDLIVEMEDDLLECSGDETTGLLIQSDDGIETNMTINGTAVNISSTLLVVTTDTEIRLIAMEGIIQIDDGSENGVVIVPGFSVSITIDEETGEPVFSEPALEDEEVIASSNAVLVDLPDNVVDEVQTVTIVVPSGTGNAVTGVSVSSEADRTRIIRQCNNGTLSATICSSLNP